VKIGDLVMSRARSFARSDRIPQGCFGIIVVRRSDMAFHVMFGDGKIRGVWMDEIEVVDESR
jgi:hypothetical protein